MTAYCLCSVSFGSYRQSANLSVAGSFPPGATTKIANVATTGPASRDLDWSWCRFRH